MVLEARIRLRNEGSPAALLGPDDCIVHVASDAHNCVATVRTDDPDLVDRIIQHNGAPFVDDHLLARTRTGAVVACRCPQRGIVADMQRLGAGIRWPIIQRDGHEWYDLTLTDADIARNVVTRLQQEGEAAMLRLAETTADNLEGRAELIDLTLGMTPRQAEALRLAHESGYYEAPRHTDLESLASRAGVARSTFQEHLAKAERRAVTAFVTMLEKGN